MNRSGTATAAESYVEHFSLNCEPFADTIDSRFFYGGTTLMQRLELLSHLTQFGDSVVLVSGPPGSGKTTLLSRFVSQPNSQWHLCLMDADEFDRFPERLADALRNETVAGEQELFSQWVARTDNSQLLVIVIDSSEHLDETALERLFALLKQATADRIRLILFGNPDAQQRHKQAFEQQQLGGSVQLLEMPRLSEEETASYLMYRLAVAGFNGENPFTATEIRAICKASDGRPAGINRLARQALLEHQARAGSKRVRVPRNIGKSNNLIWGLASAAVLALTLWLGWQNFYIQPTDKAPVAQAPLEERSLVIPEPEQLAVPGVEAPPVEVAVTPEPPERKTESEKPEPAVDPLATIQAQLSAAQTDPAAPDTATEIATRQPVVVPADQVKLEQPENTQTSAMEQNADTRSPIEVSAPQSATDTVPETKPAPHRESWLLVQPESSFSLQLLGSRNTESITGYIQQHNLDTEKSAVYKGNYKGAEWYVLLYGIYPSRQAALDARVMLPAAVRKDKPWPRTLKSVHSAIREIP